MRFYGLKGMVILGILAVLLVFGTIPAQAIPIEVNFTAVDFDFFGLHDSSSPTPPTNLVTGTIIYQADSVTAIIESLTSIDLIIDGHTYSIGEVGCVLPSIAFPLPRQKVGGIVDGVDGFGPGTDDFFLDWTWIEGRLNPIKFSYTSLDKEHIWDSNTFTSFSVAPSSPIPEPATMLFLGSGLIGLLGLRRKFRK